MSCVISLMVSFRHRWRLLTILHRIRLYAGYCNKRHRPSLIIHLAFYICSVYQKTIRRSIEQLSVYNNFGTLITKCISHRHVFLFSHLTYFVYLLYLWKLSRPNYQ